MHYKESLLSISTRLVIVAICLCVFCYTAYCNTNNIIIIIIIIIIHLMSESRFRRVRHLANDEESGFGLEDMHAKKIGATIFELEAKYFNLADWTIFSHLRRTLDTTSDHRHRICVSWWLALRNTHTQTRADSGDHI